MKKYLKYYVAFVLLATGLFGFSLLLKPVPNATGESRGIDCTQVRSTAATMNPPKTDKMWDRLRIAEQQKWLDFANLIVGNPTCFTPQLVAQYTTLLQNAH